jgi:hypothetical protein
MVHVSVQVVSSYVTPWLSNTCLISVISFVITLYTNPLNDFSCYRFCKHYYYYYYYYYYHHHNHHEMSDNKNLCALNREENSLKLKQYLYFCVNTIYQLPVREVKPPNISLTGLW